MIYIEALVGLINGQFNSPDDYPEWLKLAQSELAEWLRGAPRRKSQYFLDMANLAGYELVRTLAKIHVDSSIRAQSPRASLPAN